MFELDGEEKRREIGRRPSLSPEIQRIADIDKQDTTRGYGYRTPEQRMFMSTANMPEYRRQQQLKVWEGPGRTADTAQQSVSPHIDRQPPISQIDPMSMRESYAQETPEYTQRLQPLRKEMGLPSTEIIPREYSKEQISVPTTPYQHQEKLETIMRATPDELQKIKAGMPVGDRPIEVIRGSKRSFYSPGTDEEYSSLRDAMTGLAEVKPRDVKETIAEMRWGVGGSEDRKAAIAAGAKKPTKSRFTTKQVYDFMGNIKGRPTASERAVFDDMTKDMDYEVKYAITQEAKKRNFWWDIPEEGHLELMPRKSMGYTGEDIDTQEEVDREIMPRKSAGYTGGATGEWEEAEREEQAVIRKQLKKRVPGETTLDYLKRTGR